MFIITNLLQREHLILRLCLQEKLETVFVKSVPTQSSKSERCRIERFIFTDYRESYSVNTP
jgi:hypothetical protein